MHQSIDWQLLIFHFLKCGFLLGSNAPLCLSSWRSVVLLSLRNNLSKQTRIAGDQESKDMSDHLDSYHLGTVFCALSSSSHFPSVHTRSICNDSACSSVNTVRTSVEQYHRTFSCSLFYHNNIILYYWLIWYVVIQSSDSLNNFSMVHTSQWNEWINSLMVRVVPGYSALKEPVRPFGPFPFRHAPNTGE